MPPRGPREMRALWSISLALVIACPADSASARTGSVPAGSSSPARLKLNTAAGTPAIYHISYFGKDSALNSVGTTVSPVNGKKTITIQLVMNRRKSGRPPENRHRWQFDLGRIKAEGRDELELTISVIPEERCRTGPLKGLQSTWQGYLDDIKTHSDALAYQEVPETRLINLALMASELAYRCNESSDDELRDYGQRYANIVRSIYSILASRYAMIPDQAPFWRFPPLQ